MDFARFFYLVALANSFAAANYHIFRQIVLLSRPDDRGDCRTSNVSAQRTVIFPCDSHYLCTNTRASKYQRLRPYRLSRHNSVFFSPPVISTMPRLYQIYCSLSMKYTIQCSNSSFRFQVDFKNMYQTNRQSVSTPVLDPSRARCRCRRT